MRRLGDFLLLAEIGRGGMGKVFHARQVSLEREVALKVLPSIGGLDPDSVTRFRREAEAAGRLSHPGIVPIYAIGDVDDTHFYAMELVEGPSLFDVIVKFDGRLPESLRGTFFEEGEVELDPHAEEPFVVPDFLSASAYPASCAALILELTSALTAAHQGQVVHRDLKPSNILVRRSGHPVLVDFGLARDGLQLSLTQTGEAVGTPAYMAPEQAAGSRAIDARVDVYGLGVTLYEMLTLRPPFVGETATEVMRAIIDQDPPSPRSINPRVPRALDTIVQTCMAKDKECRYGSAAELGHDLRAFLAGGEIRARRPRFFGRLRGRLRRNRRTAWIAAVSVVCALAMGLSVGVVSVGNNRQDGMLALDNAKVFLLQSRIREAQAAYVQAQVLLGDPEFVANQRLAAFADVFPAMYANKESHATLLNFLNTLPPSDSDRPEYHTFRRRLSGIGHVTFAAGPNRDVQASVRRLKSAGLEQKWRPLPPDGGLPSGDYLVRLLAPRMAPLVVTARLQRDHRLVLEPQLKPAATVPEGMGLVARSDGGALFAVSRTEWTVGGYLDFLHAIRDPLLKKELGVRDVGPGGVSDLDPKLPVTGLSFRQMRTIAALLGGHLMSRTEYLDAATGGLHALEYPWGRTFHLDRVVGDPRYTSGLAPVASRPGGASATELFDLVGNAGEILSPRRDGQLFVAGGHHASDPAELRVHSFQPCAGPDLRDPRVGMRLARFLPGDDDGKANGRVEMRLARLRESSPEFVLNTWRIAEHGRVQLLQSFQLPPSAKSLAFPIMDGFRHLSAQAKDVAGHRLELTRENDPRLSHRLDLPSRLREAKPGGIRLAVDRWMEAVTGLYGVLDSFFMHVPFPDRDHAAMVRVELPGGSHVDRVWPAPDEMFYLDGAPVLIWERGVDASSRGPARRATIQFRRDGLLTKTWPVSEPAEKFVGRFFTALRERDGKVLDSLLAEDWRSMPNGWHREESLERLDAFPRPSDPRVIDVTAVGDMLSVEALVQHQGEGAIVERWPVRVLVRRTLEGMRVVRLMPATRPDLGRVEGGVYSQDAMGVVIEPEKGTRMVQLGDGITQLQLECRPPSTRLSLEDHWVTITGCIDGSRASATVRMKLVAGCSHGVAETVAAPAGVTTIGATGGERIQGPDEHRVIDCGEGEVWRRERRAFLTLGNRHFLIRCVVEGPSRAQAEARYRACVAWFDSILGSIRVH